MITKSQPSQITLGEDGQISWQEKPGNPLPGDVVGRIKKGDDIYSPDIEVTDPRAEEAQAVHGFLKQWLGDHIASTLDPLTTLNDVQGSTDAVKGIFQHVYDNMGVVPRETVNALTENLSPEERKTIRDYKVKLGPLLVFMPLLNKPAAVRLRALLWNLSNGKALPPKVPADGIVSFVIEGEPDLSYHQTIGYPVFGPRATRIDMLDRVVCAVYDAADKGKFQAQHQMAEWLGCPIDDLYRILEAMGHKKIYDPLENQTEATEQEKKEGESEIKPELATFRLKKGKAFEDEKAAKPAQKTKPKGKKKGSSKKDKAPKVMSAEPKNKTAESPFAVLEQLKAKSE